MYFKESKQYKNNNCKKSNIKLSNIRMNKTKKKARFDINSSLYSNLQN